MFLAHWLLLLDIRFESYVRINMYRIGTFIIFEPACFEELKK
jgi:hypothetical protein